MSRVLRFVSVVTAVACELGCRPTPGGGGSSTRLRPGVLVDSRRIPCDFGWQQEVTVSYGLLRHSFLALVECENETLTLVGLTPLQTRAFTVIQRGVAVQVVVEVPGALPFPPENILYDLHRAYFWGFSREPRDNRSDDRDLESKEDRFVAGRLVERIVTRRADGTDRVRIVYPQGYSPAAPPTEVLFENETLGYALFVVTLAATQLPPPAKGGSTTPE